MKNKLLVLLLFSTLILYFNLDSADARQFCELDASCEPGIITPPPDYTDPRGTCQCLTTDCGSNQNCVEPTGAKNKCNPGYKPRCSGTLTDCRICDNSLFEDPVLREDITQDGWIKPSIQNSYCGDIIYGCFNSGCECVATKCNDDKDNDGDYLTDDQDPGCYANDQFNINQNDENTCGKPGQPCCYGAPSNMECNPNMPGLTCVSGICDYPVAGKNFGETCTPDTTPEKGGCKPGLYCVPAYKESGKIRADGLHKCAHSSTLYWDMLYGDEKEYGKKGNTCDNINQKPDSCVIGYCTLPNSGTNRCCGAGDTWLANACTTVGDHCSIPAPKVGFDTTACSNDPTLVCCSSANLDPVQDLYGRNQACVSKSKYVVAKAYKVIICGKDYPCQTQDGICPNDYGATCNYDPDCTTCQKTDTNCGYESCQNCNNLDGCYTNSLRNYYCGGANKLNCQYTADDCSDCSCSCGDYNQPESGSCGDGKDNNCNQESDYDSINGQHGDVSCKVEVTDIQVDNTNPVENTNILVMCRTNQPNINSVEAKIQGTPCTFQEGIGVSGWIGNDAHFSCPTGTQGSKTVTCLVNTQKSYKQGTDKSTTITVKADPLACSPLSKSQCNSDPDCKWCEDCNGKKSRVGGSACIPQSQSCGTYSCSQGTCGATADADTGCPNNQCSQTNKVTYSYNDATCSCEQNTQACQGTERCEDVDATLTGSCSAACTNGDCGTCTLDVEADCQCKPGLGDSDGIKANGCEITCQPQGADCCGDNIDNDCDGTADNGCDADGDGIVSCEEVEQGSLTMCDELAKTCETVTEQESQNLVLDLAKAYCSRFDQSYPSNPERNLCKWLVCNHLTTNANQKETVCKPFCEDNDDLCRNFCKTNPTFCETPTQMEQ